MENYEKDFLKDIKEEKGIKDIIDEKNESENSFDLLMHFFANSSIGDLEKHKQVKENYHYKKLGWNNNYYFDVINSFWITFSWAMHCYKPLDYKQALFGNIKIYKNHYIDKKGEYEIDSFPEKYIVSDKKVLNETNNLLSVFSQIETIASYCHFVANFMPCPNPPFNQAKGSMFYKTYENGDEKHVNMVCDYLPLMIDLIENATKKEGSKEQSKYKGQELFYSKNENEKNAYENISEDNVYKWYEWFLDEKNRDDYCLQDYYHILSYKDGTKKLIGIPFFRGQSLDYPVPQKEDEIKECLEEIMKRIETRAIRMAKKIEQQ